MFTSLFIYTQYLLPQHLLSRCFGALANSPQPLLKNTLIRLFCRRYNVNLAEALITKEQDYPTFNQFFTRQLRPGARFVSQNKQEICSPVDGTLSQAGSIVDTTLIQAKGHHFTLNQLLANDELAVNTFSNGMFLTAYLSPRDYHRVHMPITGKLIRTTFVPGNLFSVNSLTANTIPTLYARNERLICLFETDIGQVAIILVGAMIVGSIKPIWCNEAIKSNTIRQFFPQHPIILNKGDELGLFQLGSTVILLFEQQKIQWAAGVTSNTALHLGDCIANVT